MTRRVQEHPEGGARLMRVFDRAELEHGPFGLVEIVNGDVDVHLLRRGL